MNETEFKTRTRNLGLRVLRMADALPKRPSMYAISRQLVRCATSVGANYRAACRAKSPADMLAKLAIVEEEADETAYWLDLLAELEPPLSERLQPLRQEADEITAMIVASIKTLRTRG